MSDHRHTPECAELCIGAWMKEHSLRKLRARIEAQLNTARRRGFKKTMIPLAVTQAEEVQRIRSWAAERAVRATGAEDLDAADVTGAEPEGVLSSRRGGRTVDY